MEKQNRSLQLHKELNRIAIELYKICNTGDENSNDYIILKNEFSKVFNDLYDQSEKDNYYWQYSPLSVYKSHIHRLYENFRKEYGEDADLRDFVEKEKLELYKKSNGKNLSHLVYEISFEEIIPLEDVLNNTCLRKTEYTFNRKEEFLFKGECAYMLQHLNTQMIDKTNDIVGNPYPRIFRDINSFKLFEYLHENFLNKRYELANYSFIYRQMQKDNFIYKYVGDTEFRDFLIENYNTEILEQLKTMDKIGNIDSKMRIYNDGMKLKRIILK